MKFAGVSFVSFLFFGGVFSQTQLTQDQYTVFQNEVNSQLPAIQVANPPLYDRLVAAAGGPQFPDEYSPSVVNAFFIAVGPEEAAIILDDPAQVSNLGQAAATMSGGAQFNSAATASSSGSSQPPQTQSTSVSSAVSTSGSTAGTMLIIPTLSSGSSQVSSTNTGSSAGSTSATSDSALSNASVTSGSTASTIIGTTSVMATDGSSMSDSQSESGSDAMTSSDSMSAESIGSMSSVSEISAESASGSMSSSSVNFSSVSSLDIAAQSLVDFSSIASEYSIDPQLLESFGTEDIDSLVSFLSDQASEFSLNPSQVSELSSRFENIESMSFGSNGLSSDSVDSGSSTLYAISLVSFAAIALAFF